MNLYQSFAGVAKANLEQPAVIDGETTLTYSDLLRRVEGMGAVAAALSTAEAVGVYLPTGAGFVVSAYGLFRAGFALLPLNLLAKPADLAFAVQDSGIDMIFTSQLLASRLEGVPARLVMLEDLVRQAAEGQTPPLQALEGRPVRGEDDLAVLLYTSGTTGTPKGVRLTHGNILSNIADCLQVFEVGPDDVIIGILPLFHTFALTGTMGIALHSGGRFVTQMRFAPDAALDAIAKHGVTLLIAVPSMFRVLTAAQRHAPRDVSSLRFGVAGGEPLPPRVAREFAEVFGVPLLEGYGLTESSPVISINVPSANKPGTAGKPLPSVRLRIRGEDGAELPSGEVGEIYAAGPNIMQGYHNRPEETAQVVQDGWLVTGDMGFIDSDGYVTITGRRKEMIIVSGFNVFPAEVEAELSEHPAVAHCAVIGVADESHGEVIKAVVVPRDPGVLSNGGVEQLERELREFLRARLTAYKMPRVFEFRAEVPLGPTGKVLKREL